MTLIVGNLDCESEFAALSAGRGRSPLGSAAFRTISDAATLLRAFAEPTDRLWTPLPVDPHRLPEVAGVAAPELISGPRPRVSEERALSGERVLAWGSGSGLRGQRTAKDRLSGDVPLARRLLATGLMPLSIAASVNHRSLALELAFELGTALPGARLIASVEELREHLEGGGAAAGVDSRWVAKAPHSAAGRLRFIAPRSHDPVAILGDARIRARIDRLLRAQGSLLFEPWMERVDDWGCLFLIRDDGVEIVGTHRLVVGRGGAFEGVSSSVTADEGDDQHPGEFRVGALREADRATLQEIAGEVAQRLRERGYRGPAGVDAWRYRNGDEVLLNPLGEINARLSFGWVWRAWRERLQTAGVASVGEPVELRLGRGLPPVAPGVHPLLLPGDDSEVSAWLGVGASPSVVGQGR